MEQDGELKIGVADVSGNALPCHIHRKQQDGSAWMLPDVRKPK
jgi:hypothetical protein